MRRFLVHTLLFCLPFVLVFSPIVVVLYASGELTPLSSVEALQMKNDRTTLYNPMYSNFVYKLKQELTIQKRPQVLALGSSHVGQFSAYFFKDPETFYNATGAISAMSDFQSFTRSLGGVQPKVIIMSADISAFNTTSSRDHLVRPDRFSQSVSSWDVVSESLVRNQAWWHVYVDYASHKFTLPDVFAPTTPPLAIGLLARSSKLGYINDGSTYYGNIVSSPHKQKQTGDAITALLNEISDTNGYEYGPAISPEALTLLRAFLADSKQKYIHVVGFLPPIPESIYTKMLSLPHATYRESFITLGPTLAKIYKEYGFEFFDFTHITPFGGRDDEMIDPYHGSQKLYARMLVHMARESDILAAYVDIPGLQQKIQNASSSVALFELSLK